MALGFGTIIYVSLLLTNAIAILSEERFLAGVIGWSTTQPQPATYDPNGFGEAGGPGVKARIIVLISAVRTLLRMPLIFCNLVLIFYELILG
ncbi:hypothetical protein BS47DRAFT_1294172 [Hydnum rufescens UP504]|uniref:Yos1-like protein n=1 Tax=Hydnum rufescens UP504 TaxID=1448309 RepID=A0A9P6B0G2_9AGAM|nr:hypothetical protein BS47DRAFT_1294172 [Hydnum rufescens UP504]